MKKSSFGKFVLGATIGAGIGLLFAPKTGKETRAELKAKFDELVKKTKEIEVDEVKKNILNKIEEIQEELKDLDKEKVLKLAKSKAKDIEKKSEELVKMAMDSAKPKLEQMATEAKKSTVKTLKNVISKLEEDEKVKKASKKA